LLLHCGQVFLTHREKLCFSSAALSLMSLHSGLRPTPSYWLLHSYLQHFSSDLLQRRDPAIVDVIHLAASALSAQGDAIAEPGPRTLHVPVNRIERQVGCGRNTVLISVHDPHSSCPSWRMGDQALMRAVASLFPGLRLQGICNLSKLLWIATIAVWPRGVGLLH
jgi:hypothetical protein